MTEHAQAGPINWYTIDFAASSYGLDSGADVMHVGDVVHTKFTAVDQKGEPISGMKVNFFRTGPDDLQDGEGKSAVDDR